MKNSFKLKTKLHYSDYIVRDHQVHGVRIMPGVTFFDLIYRALEDEGFDDISQYELRNVVFIKPVSVTESSEKEIELRFEKKQDSYLVTGWSRTVEEEWTENIKGQIVRKAQKEPDKINIPDLIQKGNKTYDMKQAYEIAQKLHIKHGEFMKGLGEAYRGEDYLLAHINLGSLAQKYLKNTYIHPALLDCATIVANLFLLDEYTMDEFEQEGFYPYIPICLERFTTYKAIRSDVYVLARMDRKCFDKSQDVNNHFISIYDPDGYEIATFHKLSSKRIRNKGLVGDKKPEVVKVQEIKMLSSASGTSSVTSFLQAYVAKKNNSEAESVDTQAGFYDLGLDSVDLMELVQELEVAIQNKIYPTIAFEYPSIDELAGYLDKNGYRIVNVEEIKIGSQEVKSSQEIFSETDTEKFLIQFLSEKFGIAVSPPDTETAFYDLGLDSSDLLELVQELEGLIERKLYPTLLFEYPSIHELAGYLQREALSGALQQPDKVEETYELAAFEERYLLQELVYQKTEETIWYVKAAWEESFTGILSVEEMERRFKNGEHVSRIVVDYGYGGIEDWKPEDVLETGYQIIQAILKYQKQQDVWVLFTYGCKKGTVVPELYGLSGFAKTVNLEQKKIFCSVICLELEEAALYENTFSKVLEKEAYHTVKDEVEILYMAGTRYINRLIPTEEGDKQILPVSVKDGGIYLITGGTGKLAALFAKKLLENAVTVIMAGRREESEEWRQWKAQTEQNSGQLFYERVDITSYQEVEDIVKTIKARFGKIDGILHTAGVIDDGMVRNKKMDSMRKVLLPKTEGICNLDKATSKESLDFFIAFSSIAGVNGNIGQADYAYANCFMKGYLQEREKLQKQGKRSGSSIAMNWQYWQQGSMTMEPEAVELMRKTTGLCALTRDAGMMLWDKYLALGQGRNVLLCGDKIKLLEIIRETYPVRTVFGKNRCQETKEVSIKDDIAIIGFSGRYPKSENVEMFWENLKNGMDCIEPIPEGRWKHEEYYSSKKGEYQKYYLQYGGFIKDVDKFDPIFFQISPKDAEYMDPQERLFMENVWCTMENAGYSKNSLKHEKVGVFVGVMWGQYQLYGLNVPPKTTIPISTYASVANRVSYFFDFKGPSMVVDTMCSSSLSAIHLACESIARGDCNYAIAGGVNVTIHPNKYLFLCQNHFASEDGKCRSFGEGGSGYVPGEGVGSILLKSLSKAKEDGDSIYGVIKGIALNHGGKTGGYSVPSPVAQAQVLQDALQQANLSPEQISYVEAHGTGTPLGDPIEIDGLKKVLEPDNQRKNPLYVGSVKSNIGHLESAAGIAAIEKVLLMFAHKKLVPSLHSKEINRNINLDDSKLHILQELQDWQPEEDGVRRALISSFGAGGANAAIILEEGIEPKPVKEDGREKAIVFSARTKENLNQFLNQTCEFLQENRDISLTQIAYTLQFGRTIMYESVIFTVRTIEELEESIRRFLKGEVVRNCITQYEQTYVEQTNQFQKGEYQPVPLGNYPFAKERYWVESVPKATEKAKISSLLDDNISDMYRVAFHKKINRSDCFVKDHVVGNHSLLPGAVSLEIAAESGKFAEPFHKIVGLKDVKWIRPIICEEEKELSIELYQEQDGMAFSMFEGIRVGDNPLVTGKLLTSLFETKQEAINIPECISQCTAIQSKVQFYQMMKERGFIYGETFQTIQEIWCSEKQAVGKIELSDISKMVFAECILQPYIIDAAFQAVNGITLKQEVYTGKQFLPFGIERCVWYGDSLVKGYVCVELKEDSFREDGSEITFDIKVLDETGQVNVQIDGFTLRSKTEAAQEGPLETIFVKQELQQEDIACVTNQEGVYLAVTENMQFVTVLKQLLPQATITSTGWNENFEETELIKVLNSKSKQKFILFYFDEKTEQKHTFWKVINALKLLMRVHTGKDDINLCVCEFAGKIGIPEVEALEAVGRTAELENSRLHFKQISLCNPSDALRDNFMEETVKTLLQEMAVPSVDEKVVYAGKKRFVSRLVEMNLQKGENKKIKKSGIYLVTGGAGGIGKLLVEYLIQQYDARIIVCGRSTKEKAFTDGMNGLLREGLDRYIQADLADEQQVKVLIDTIEQNYGKLDGVFHCTGVTKDALLVNKTEIEMKAVLCAKVDGTISLVKYTNVLNMDLFVAFSSTTALMGNVGQCDYAYANAYMKEYLRQQNEISETRYVTLSWPLWADGGMQMEEAAMRSLAVRTGMIPMPTKQAIDAMEEALGSDHDEVGIVYGIATKIRKQLEQINEAQNIEASFDREKASILVIDYLKEVIAREIKLPKEKLSVNEVMDSYGIDSIVILNVMEQLDEKFTKLPRTMLYEYKTIQEMADYLLETHHEQVAEVFGVEKKEIAPKSVHNEPVSVRKLQQSSQVEDSEDEISVVGFSGRFPEADSVEEFWDNIKQGKDCVKSMPMERFGRDSYFEGMDGIPAYGGFLRDIKSFDSMFFHITPKEAAFMDPQERIFLEEIWKAIEDAGYTLESIQGKKVGVFVGVMYGHYQFYGVEETQNGNPSAIASSFAAIANRVSYYFNFNGPSFSVDSMCSSSLTALHLAVNSLQKGECEIAILGGVNVCSHPNKYILLNQGHFLSEDGKCRSFGEGGTGYVPGEGVGAVVLRKKKEAIREKDLIYSVIKSSSINHGGKTNGFTVPNPIAQAELIKEALHTAKLDQNSIGYIEAHGTGTALGDPIEIAGLVRVFGTGKGTDSCAIGSVKSNIGHLESAAGIAALVKVSYMLHERMLVPSIHSEVLNSAIDFTNSPFYVQQKLEEWNCVGDSIRRAGISSFGAGGANAHVILEEYKPLQQIQSEQIPKEFLMVFSAQDEEDLWMLVDAMRNCFTVYQDKLGNSREAEKEFLYRASYTLQCRRNLFPERMAFVADSISQAILRMEEYLSQSVQNQNLFLHTGTKNDFPSRHMSVKEAKDMATSFLRKKEYKAVLQLWVEGYDPDFGILYEEQFVEPVRLASYQFKKESYWVKQETQGRSTTTHRIAPFINENVSTIATQKYKTVFSKDEVYLQQHCVQGKNILPGAVFTEIALESASLASEESPVMLDNLIWHAPFYPNEQNALISIIEADGDKYRVNIYEESQIKCSCKISTDITKISLGELMEFRTEGLELLDRQEFYEGFANAGFQYGEAFQLLSEIKRDVQQGYCVAKYQVKHKEEQNNRGMFVYPTVLDAAFQLVSAVIKAEESSTPYLPYQIGHLELLRNMTESGYIMVKMVSQDSKKAVFELIIVNQEGKITLMASQFTLGKSNNETVKKGSQKEDDYLMALLDQIEHGEIDFNAACGIVDHLF